MAKSAEKFKVKAIEKGYYAHKRRSIGEVFMMDEKHLALQSDIKDEDKLKKLVKVKSKAGDKYVLPTWVVSVDGASVKEELSSAAKMAKNLPPGSIPAGASDSASVENDADADESTGDKDVI